MPKRREKQNNERIKQSFLAGSLTSSAGIFLAKAIGLLYVVPFTALATENNMSFYSAAYTYYNILLQICSAGLPYAISAIVAKYVNRGDYRTVVLVRKLSTGILSVAGFLMAVIFSLIANVQAHSILGPGTNAADIQSMVNCFRILAIALFLVPVLYSYRGFYQGFREMRAYADSQVIEQFARVASLLGLGYLFVRVLQFDSIWAVYMAVLATSIGALAALIYYVRFDHHHYGPIARAARAQETPAVDRSQILKELFAFGLPYLLSSVLGNTQTLINTNFFIRVNTGLGMDYETAKLLYGIIEVQCDKLTSIPQVLGNGFSASIVPYMTTALENRDMEELRKDIRLCLDTVLYIALPICFCMFTLARPIYFIMYGGANLDYGEMCLTFASILGLVTTITPMCNTMLMTLNLRKECIFYLCVGFVVKCATFYPLTEATGYTGAITSSILTSLTIIYLTLTKLHNIYGVSYRQTGIRFVKMLLACFCMNAVFAAFKLAGLTITESSRLLALVQLAGYGICGAFVYVWLTGMMKVPQGIFHKSMKELLRFGRR